MSTDKLTPAVDLFSDALRFSKEARRAETLGKIDEAVHFAALAKQSAQGGVFELDFALAGKLLVEL